MKKLIVWWWSILFLVGGYTNASLSTTTKLPTDTSVETNCMMIVQEFLATSDLSQDESNIDNPLSAISAELTKKHPECKSYIETEQSKYAQRLIDSQDKWLKSLTLNSSNITDYCDKTATSCNLSSRQIVSIAEDTFVWFTVLESLNLKYNQLTTLPENVFDSLISLEGLSIENNLFATFPSWLFADLNNIKRLFLWNNNQLTTIPENIFAGLDTLQLLYLDNNLKLTTLPENVFDGLSSLEVLNLERNQLTTLPENVFDGLSSLEVLNLGHNQLTTLPENVFDGLGSLGGLQRLYLYNNQITTLPENVFDGLSNLETLDLHNNQITTLPENVFDGLSSLEVLDLRNNPTQTPTTIDVESLPLTDLTCPTDYGEIAEQKCIKNWITQTLACVWLVDNAHWNGSGYVYQTFNYWYRSPSNIVYYDFWSTQNNCSFSCNVNYMRNGSACVDMTNATNTVVCQTDSLPKYWVINRVNSYTQVFSGNWWFPNNGNTYSHNVNGGDDGCYFTCEENTIPQPVLNNAEWIGLWYQHTCILLMDWNVQCQWEGPQASDYFLGDAYILSVGDFGNCIIKTNWDAHCRWEWELVDEAESYIDDYTWNIKNIYIWNWHGCILDKDGNVDCFGRYEGQDGAKDYTWWDAIAMDGQVYNTCIINDMWNVFCRGGSSYNDHWQSEPYYWWDAIQLSLWDNHTCILKSNGNVMCQWLNNNWQSNDYMWGDAVQVSAWDNYTCILKSNNSVDCRWINNYGQSNDQSFTKDIKRVEAWDFHTCVVDADGNVDCWWKNDFWQAEDYMWWDATAANTDYICVWSGTRRLTCDISTLPEFTIPNTVTWYLQTRNPDLNIRTPDNGNSYSFSLTWSDDACHFVCEENTTFDADTNTCVPDTRQMTCDISTLPEFARPNTVTGYLQTRNPELNIRTPDNGSSYSFSQTGWTDGCYFNCIKDTIYYPITNTCILDKNDLSINIRTISEFGQNNQPINKPFEIIVTVANVWDTLMRYKSHTLSTHRNMKTTMVSNECSNGSSISDWLSPRETCTIRYTAIAKATGKFPITATLARQDMDINPSNDTDSLNLLITAKLGKDLSVKLSANPTVDANTDMTITASISNIGKTKLPVSTTVMTPATYTLKSNNCPKILDVNKTCTQKYTVRSAVDFDFTVALDGKDDNASNNKDTVYIQISKYDLGITTFEYADMGVGQELVDSLQLVVQIVNLWNVDIPSFVDYTDQIVTLSKDNNFVRQMRYVWWTCWERNLLKKGGTCTFLFDIINSGLGRGWETTTITAQLGSIPSVNETINANDTRTMTITIKSPENPR